MVRSLHVRRWALGGTVAVMAGLAASAEPLAPLLSQVDTVTPVAFVAPPEVPDLRPRARPLASVPVAAAIRTGAALRPPVRPVFTASAAWDRTAEGKAWSVAAMRAIDAAPRDLTEIVPADIQSWCPGYANNPRHLRAAFWVGTVSALARYESTFREDAQGGGGAWHGLLQISPATARHHGCEATSAAELHDGAANLACGLRIMSRTVARDGVVSANRGGIAADWGPMSNPSLRENIREWVSGQAYCKATGQVWAALVPPVRPDHLSPEPLERVIAFLDPRMESALLR